MAADVGDSPGPVAGLAILRPLNPGSKSGEQPAPLQHQMKAVTAA